MKRSHKEGIIALILAFLQFGTSFLYEDKIFYINLKTVIASNGDNIKKYLIFKLSSLLLYYLVYRFLLRIFKKVIKKDKDTLQKIKLFSIYLIINVILLLLTWPGVWRWDEFGILKYATIFKFYYWQNFLTSIFYILSYSLIPIPSGVIIIQIIIVSCIVSDIIYEFSKIFRNSKLVYLLFIPFILLPVLEHNLYPIRLTLYSYVELLLICKLIFIKKLKNQKWSFIVLSFTLIILSTLRSEGKVFIVLIPIVFIFILKTEIDSIVKRIVYTVVTIAISICLIVPQDYYYKHKASSKYDVTSYINQLSVAAKCEKNNNPNSEELKEIDKIIDLEQLLSFPTGIEAHNSEKIYRKNIEGEKFTELKKLCVKLIVKYPKETIEERLLTFAKASGLVRDKNIHVADTRTIYTEPANTALLIFRNNYRKCY